MELTQILTQPESKRDAQWEQSFFSALVSGHVDIVEDLPQSGPDGWPYLLVKSSPAAKEPVRQVLSWLSENGVGLVVNAHKNMPDYIFTYGMIWNFRERAQFLSPAQARSVGSVEYGEKEVLKMGPPISSYLPSYVAKVLVEFFKNIGVEDAKVLVLGSDVHGYDLCFSLESLGLPPEQEHKGILTTLAWFVPAHYSLVLVSEQGLRQFVSLKDLSISNKQI